MKKKSTRQHVYIALLITLGIVLQLAESYMNIIPTIPGGKLGLANIVTVIALYLFSPSVAIFICVMRAGIGSLLSSGGISFLYSMSGALCSAVAMILVYKLSYPKVGFIGLCIIGAFFHNLAQILVAMAVLTSYYILSYLPILTVVSAVCGLATGIVSTFIINAFSKIRTKGVL